MLLQKAFRLKLYPNANQRGALKRAGAATRSCWNILLAENMFQYDFDKTFCFYKQMTDNLPALKAMQPWLYDAPACSLQRVARYLDTALRMSSGKHINRKGFPKFKRKDTERDSFYLTNQAISIINTSITIYKVGKVRFRGGALPQGRILSATVTQDGSLWWISVLCEIDIADPMVTPFIEANAVGLDLGLNELLVTSDGEVFPIQKFERKAAKQLARAQRTMARRQKGGKNRAKARKRVQKLHRRTKDCRSSHAHVISRQIVNEYDVIFTEDLNVKGMMKGNIARSVADAGWSTLINQIAYKAKWAGKNHIRIGRYEPSSQLCSGCGARQRIARGERTYRCACGLELDRDLNAAINVREIGLKKLVGECQAEFTPVEIPLMETRDACVSLVSHVSLKQEINLPIVSG